MAAESCRSGKKATFDSMLRFSIVWIDIQAQGHCETGSRKLQNGCPLNFSKHRQNQHVHQFWTFYVPELTRKFLSGSLRTLFSCVNNSRSDRRLGHESNWEIVLFRVVRACERALLVRLDSAKNWWWPPPLFLFGTTIFFPLRKFGGLGTC